MDTTATILIDLEEPVVLRHSDQDPEEDRGPCRLAEALGGREHYLGDPTINRIGMREAKRRAGLL